MQTELIHFFYVSIIHIIARFKKLFKQRKSSGLYLITRGCRNTKIAKRFLNRQSYSCRMQKFNVQFLDRHPQQHCKQLVRGCRSGQSKMDTIFGVPLGTIKTQRFWVRRDRFRTCWLSAYEGSNPSPRIYLFYRYLA